MMSSRLNNSFIFFTILTVGAAGQPLDQRVGASVTGFPATVSIHAKNLRSGAAFSLRADEPVRTASTIKLPIMAAVFAAVADGKASWPERITLRIADKVSGSGVLTEFSDGVAFPIRDLVHLMIVVSDNTATNLLLDRFTPDLVNHYLAGLGLARTRSLRKVRGDGSNLKAPSGWSVEGRKPENERFGIGVSTPREMVLLLEKLERGEVVSADVSREMVSILRRQQYKDGIGRWLRWPVASKSGALDALRSDVGLVYCDGGPVALAITVDGMPQTDYSADNRGNQLIADLARTLVEGLAPR